MTDLDSIIKGCIAGNGDMQRELYERYSPRFYALCCRYAVDEAEAEDILVEGFTTIFTQVTNFRGEGSFEGWMQTIFVRRASLYYRRHARQRQLQVDDGKQPTLNPAKVIDRQIDVQRAVHAAMQHLSDKERLTFNMIAIEGYTFAEAAQIQERPVSTVKSQYYKALWQMQRRLRRSLGINYLKEYEQ